MLTTKPTLIITFPTTTQAMAAERCCEHHHLPGRLVPIPAVLSAGCGLSWAADPSDKEGLLRAFADDGITYETVTVIDL